MFKSVTEASSLIKGKNEDKKTLYLLTHPF